ASVAASMPANTNHFMNFPATSRFKFAQTDICRQCGTGALESQWQGFTPISVALGWHRTEQGGRMRRLIPIAIAAVYMLLAAPANAKPPLEAFGDAPTIRSAQLSPDGKIVAFINRVNGVDYLAKYDMETGKNEALIKIPDIKAGGIGFAGP